MGAAKENIVVVSSERREALFAAYCYLRDTRNHETSCDFEEQGICTCDACVLVEGFKKKFFNELSGCPTVAGDSYTPFGRLK